MLNTMVYNCNFFAFEGDLADINAKVKINNEIYHIF